MTDAEQFKLFQTFQSFKTFKHQPQLALMQLETGRACEIAKPRRLVQSRVSDFNPRCDCSAYRVETIDRKIV